MKQRIIDLQTSINITFFQLAHVSGSLEFYTLILDSEKLQKAVHKEASGEDKPFNTISRQANISVEGENRPFTWYPGLTPESILGSKDLLFGFVYHNAFFQMLSAFDRYLKNTISQELLLSEDNQTPTLKQLSLGGINIIDLPNIEYVDFILNELSFYRDGSVPDKISSKDLLAIVQAKETILDFSKKLEESVESVASPWQLQTKQNPGTIH